jgi:SOS response regulatory protein OraA/RecX
VKKIIIAKEKGVEKAWRDSVSDEKELCRLERGLEKGIYRVGRRKDSRRQLTNDIKNPGEDEKLVEAIKINSTHLGICLDSKLLQNSFYSFASGCRSRTIRNRGGLANGKLFQ